MNKQQTIYYLITFSNHKYKLSIKYKERDCIRVKMFINKKKLSF